MSDTGPGAAGGRVDRMLVGRYQLTQFIASGGMAEVWEGRDLRLARPVAIKMPLPHLRDLDQAMTRFRREAVAAAKLSHPNVVAVYDTGTDGPDTFIVMERVSGESLAEMLAHQGRMDIDVSVAIAAQVAAALEFAHRAGVVHRDIKPANILVTTEGQVKVTDFGIAKAIQDEGLTDTRGALGTARYASPEQIEGRTPDGRTDVYALGVVLYEMLCGRAPFRADSEIAVAMAHMRDLPARPSTLRREIPNWLEGVVLRALAKDPDQRFESAATMRSALLAGGGPGGPGDLLGNPPGLFGGEGSRTAAPSERAAGTSVLGQGLGLAQGPPVGGLTRPDGPDRRSPNGRDPTIGGDRGASGEPGLKGGSGGPGFRASAVPAPGAGAVPGGPGSRAGPGSGSGSGSGSAAGGPGSRAGPGSGSGSSAGSVPGSAASPGAGAVPGSGPGSAPGSGSRADPGHRRGFTHRAGSGSGWAGLLGGKRTAQPKQHAAPAKQRRWIGGRRLLPQVVAAVVVVALVVAGVLLIELGGGRSPNGSGTSPSGGSTAGSASGTAAGEAIQVAGGVLFDHIAGLAGIQDPGDNPAEIPNLYDGNPSTSWSTSIYKGTFAQAFGNLKPGVGFVLELSSSDRLSQLSVLSSASTLGWTASVYVSDQVQCTLGAWGSPVATETASGTTTNFSLGGKQGSEVLVWLTKLGAADQATVDEASLTGTAGSSSVDVPGTNVCAEVGASAAGLIGASGNAGPAGPAELQATAAVGVGLGGPGTPPGPDPGAPGRVDHASYGHHGHHGGSGKGQG